MVVCENCEREVKELKVCKICGEKRCNECMLGVHAFRHFVQVVKS